MKGPLCLLIFLAVFYTHTSSRVIISSDSRWSILTARSLLTDGDLELSEYSEILERNKNYCIYSVQDRKYNLFPVGPALFALPFIALFDAAPSFFSKFLPGLEKLEEKHKRKGTEFNSLSARLPLERAIASISAALAALIMFLTFSRELRAKYALILTLIFSFCTSLWSTASRGLWQHGPSILTLSFVLFLVAKPKLTSSLALILGAVLAASYIVRPTNSLSIIFLSLFVLARHRSVVVSYLLGLSIILAPFIISSYTIYGSILPPYYSPQRLNSNPDYLEAIFGNLFSPARGLFIFSPFLVFSILGAIILCKTDNLARYLGVIVVLHLLIVSSFFPWWGGHSYGPRFMSDMLPYLFYFLLPIFKVLDQGGLRNSPARAATFAVLAAFSLYVHYVGATSPRAHLWNVKPTSIDAQPGRVWDWRDPPFLRRL
ncbi:MAG: hypothetical protein DCC75_04805 [Proteobacteria bacterium]|nr:MAG: hypothetical protein DCC75_04805 [Pseudomonadota bacterium]